MCQIGLVQLCARFMQARCYTYNYIHFAISAYSHTTDVSVNNKSQEMDMHVPLVTLVNKCGL